MTTTIYHTPFFADTISALDCSICQSKDSIVSPLKFECSCQVPLCNACSVRCAPILLQCPLCFSSRSPTFPATLTLEKALDFADKSLSRYPSVLNPTRSVGFLVQLSSIYARKLSLIYPTHRLIREVAPTQDPIDVAVDRIPFASSADLIASHPALMFSSRPEAADPPHLVSWRFEKLEPPSYLANLYYNWVRLKYLTHGRGCIQTISCLPVNPYPDPEAMACSQFKWAKHAVSPALDCLLTNAVNACRMMRARSRKGTCPAIERLGDYPHVNAMIVISGCLYVPALKSDSSIRGPYVMFSDHTSLCGVPAQVYRNCREICDLYRLPFEANDPDPITASSAPTLRSPSPLFQSRLMSLTQWIRSADLFGDAVLKAVHQFSKDRHIRTVFSLVLGYHNRGSSTIAVAVRVPKRTIVQPTQLMFDPNGNNTNVMPNNETKSDEQTQSPLADSNEPNDESTDTEMVTSNVSLIKSPLESKKSGVLYIYKVASLVPIGGHDAAYEALLEPLSSPNTSPGTYSHKTAFGQEHLVIVKLGVPPAARIAISRDESKVRVSDAVVLDIRPILLDAEPVYHMQFATADTCAGTFRYGDSVDDAYSCVHRGGNVTYTKGERVTALPFSEDLDAVCVPGIHGCIMQSEAIGYGLSANTDFIVPEQIDAEHFASLDAVELSLNNN
jgi:hypothetical protein